MRSRMTYANVMATIAVFIALGGTGYALSKLPKDSVKAKQIATDAVGAEEIQAGAVGTAEVAEGSLLSSDFGANQLPTGPAGPQGPAGANGQDGQDGQDGSQGPPGPVFAATTNRADPLAVAEFPGLRILNFTTPAAGKLLVRFDSVADPSSVNAAGVKIDCTAGTAEVGLYVDGVAVPDTQLPLLDDTFAVFSLTGITATAAPAGAHTLMLNGDCPTGNAPTASASNASTLSAILLGN
jgi:hypothetical protein